MLNRDRSPSEATATGTDAHDTSTNKPSTLRVTPFVALVLGVTLLAAGLLLTAGVIAQSHQQQHTLQRDAGQVSD